MWGTYQWKLLLLMWVSVLSLSSCGKEHVCTWERKSMIMEPTCTEDGLASYLCTECNNEKEEKVPALGHDMVVEWYGEPPDCVNEGYCVALCDRCGWIDEAACSSVPALEHVPVASELQHGNCREDTIIVYICSVCGEQTGYERYPELDEHEWVLKDTLVWDEASFSYKITQIECCERCNLRPWEVVCRK